MATEVLMPKLGLTMTEGTIDEWKKKVGDTVAKGEILFSVETDKLTNDVEAEADGVLLAITVPAGETVACKTVIGWLGAAGEAVPAGGASAAAAAPAIEAARAESEGRIRELERMLAQADPETQAFKMRFVVWQEAYNQMADALGKIAEADPAKAEKLKVAVNKAWEGMSVV